MTLGLRPLQKVTSGFVAIAFLALAGACRQDMHDQPKYKLLAPGPSSSPLSKR